jgi:hypothetical protein
LLFGNFNEDLLNGDQFNEIKFDPKDISLNLKSIKFGGRNINNSSKITINLAKDNIIVTQKIYNQIDSLLTDLGIQCGFLNKRILCYFDKDSEFVSNRESLPGISFWFDDNEYLIDSNVLFYESDKLSVKDKEYFVSWLRIEVGESIQLGAPFFNQFYTYFDMEKSVILVRNHQKNEISNKQPANSNNSQDEIVDHPAMGWEVSMLIIVFFLALFVVIILYRKHAHGIYSDISKASQKTNTFDSSDTTADYGPSINYRDPKARQIAAQEIEDTL